MIRSTLLSILVLSLPLAFAGCGGTDFYDREYVFYDSTQEPDPAANGNIGVDGKPKTAEAATKTKAEPSPAAGVAVAPAVAPADDDIDRIFLLEGMYDELGRAIRDGVGDLDALRLKQQDIGREIAWRREAVGEAYDQARRERLEQLREFPIVVK